ncbi:serine/threonine-protein phosphatase 4 regulatory subunit 2-like isoform X2 [Ostrea edulis]|uniref:serine/threonine-protein phosphatase 4 regulatory subunit 2-like isoform X2 n=1 Tax=Ostrea edulis TaxID=37623 RepID=UPI002094E7FC|nr:serine/threonine-protein phosphatase 4 regulatory subunit 2-like isoform X2 [Ostrea edulis]
MVVYSNLTMDNQEEILDALNNFEKKKGDISPVLEQYLRRIAKTGETLFPWPRVKPLFVNKLEDVMSKFHLELPVDHLTPCPNVENPKFTEMRKRILDSVNRFSGAPFTIQRLCELLTDPKKHYKRTDKFLRGIEKNVLVISTVDPYGNKIVSESRATMVNGLDSSPVNGNEADSPTTTTNLTPVQYSGFPTQQQTNWTTDSWAGMGPSQATPGHATSSSETSPTPREPNLTSEKAPCDNQSEGEDLPPREELTESEEAASDDVSPVKKPKLSNETEEEDSPTERPAPNDGDKQTDTADSTAVSTDDTKESSDNVVEQSAEVLKAEDSRVNQGSENSSEAETPGDKESEAYSTQEQKDLDEQSSPESSQNSESKSSDSSLPQDSITDKASNVQQDQSLPAEKLLESPQDSTSQETTESQNQEGVSTQLNQPPVESTEVPPSPQHSEEERMSVDIGAEKVEPTENMDSCTESTHPCDPPTEEETPMEED